MEYDKTIWHDADKELPPSGERVLILTKVRKNGKIQKGCFAISFGSVTAKRKSDGSQDNNNARWNQKDVMLWARSGLPKGTDSPDLEMEISALQHVIDIMQSQMQYYSGRTLDNIIQNLMMILNVKKKKLNGLNKNT